MIGSILRFDRIQVNDSGLYECKASYPLQGSSLDPKSVLDGAERLRKLVRLIVNGK